MDFPVMSVRLPTTKIDDINFFENEISIKLCPEYKQFLAEVNGGRPKYAVFPIKGLELNPVGEINALFGLQNQVPSCDLSSVNRWFSGRIPKDIVIIGGDAGINYICIDQRHGNKKVMFWDHAHFWSTGEWREGDLYPIADTFINFLANLAAAPSP
jgi:SMI1 / KNR4 family (SUKH-1)